MTVDKETQQQIETQRSFGDAVCNKIAQSIQKLGFAGNVGVLPPRYEDAVFNLVTDPYTQIQNLTGFWYDANQQRIGQIKFNGEGGVYAEFDVVQPHPIKKGLFVEAINAWGKQDNLKAEAKLLDIPQ